MDAFAGQRGDHGLSDLPQADAVAGHRGVILQQPKDVAADGLGIHAEEQVRGGEVEEAQGMGLDHLGAVEQPTQIPAGRRHSCSQNGIAGLGRGQGVTHREDAADTFHQGRHFVKGAPFAEFFESPELGGMKAGIGHLAGLVQLDGDFAVAFNAGDGIDNDRRHHDATSQVWLTPLPSGAEAAAANQVRHMPLQERRQQKEDGIGRRWAARQESIHLHVGMDRSDAAQ